MFLKIRTKLFSRLRNRGFKKVWLRKTFRLVQYEDRSKLLNNSQKTLPDFQVVTETEAESLVVQDSERILRENGIPRLCFNPGSKEVRKENRLGADILVPLDPLVSGGGTISTGPSNFCVRNSKLTSSKELSSPIQGSGREAAAIPTAATPRTATAVQKEKVGSKIPPITEVKDKEDEVFLVLPSFAEPFSQNIKQIICHEKKKLCKHKKYNAIFSNTKIRLAFTNNKSVKKLIVRTKI